MARHIFLTGKKQIGKSTLIQKVLKSYPINGANGKRFPMQQPRKRQNSKEYVPYVKVYRPESTRIQE